jgi:hypothetical protein
MSRQMQSRHLREHSGIERRPFPGVVASRYIADENIDPASFTHCGAYGVHRAHDLTGLGYLYRCPRRRDLIPLVEVVKRLEHSDLIGLPLYDSALAHLASPELTQLSARPDVTDAELDLFAALCGGRRPLMGQRLCIELRARSLFWAETRLELSYSTVPSVAVAGVAATGAAVHHQALLLDEIFRSERIRSV